MAVIASAGNTYNPCLLVLRTKGYHLWLVREGDQLFWKASQQGSRFSAHSPAELLGLVTLWEHLGESWNQQEPDLLAELFNNVQVNSDGTQSIEE
jgi:hypothetical protein